MVEPPLLSMCTDDVLTGVLRNYAVWNLDLVTRFCINIFILEHLCDVRGLAHQDVPLATEEQLHRSVFLEGLPHVLAVEFSLIHIFEQRKESVVEWDGRYVFGEAAGRCEEVNKERDNPEKCAEYCNEDQGKI